MKNQRRHASSLLSTGSLAAIGIGVASLLPLAALAGWAFGVPILAAWGSPGAFMRPVSALCFLLAAATLAFLRGGGTRRDKVIVSSVGGGLLCAVSLVTAGFYLAEVFSGSPVAAALLPELHWLFGPAARIPGLATLLLFLLGTGLVLLGTGRALPRHASHVLIVPAAVVSYLIIVGYILNVRNQWIHLGVALNTAISFFGLSFAFFALAPDTWLTKSFVGPYAGSAMARRLLPGFLLLPIVIGWMRLTGERTGFFESEVGVVLVAAAYAVCFAALVGLAARFVNRTDRTSRAAVESLKESEERFRLLFHQAAVGIKRIDPAGLVIEVNDKLCDILGYSREELLHLTLAQITHAEDLSREQAELERLFAREIASYTLEKRAIRKDGRVIWVRVTSSLPSITDPAPWWISVVEDVTERTLAEAELARSNRDLEQFAYVSSHDLQEPLRMVTGFMQLFEQKYRALLDTTGAEYVRFAVEGAHRMQQLIDDLLSYSRVGSRAREPVPVDAGKALTEALTNLRARLQESGAEISFGKLPTVRADSSQLAQVFQNLVGNALKFHGGKPPKVEITASRNSGNWLFSVRDEGIGIEPEHFERIFMIFQRLHTREEYPGTGIGLAICKKIVERYGGRIWVESNEGRGAVFHFTLPE